MERTTVFQKTLNVLRKTKKVLSLSMAMVLTTTMFQLPVLAKVEEGIASQQEAVGQEAQVLAFPGAEGGGRFATGGRGQDVYIVTNLEDYAFDETPIDGSLRYGLQSNRTIVFNVSGVIELKESLRFAGLSNITIAGQTAPGDGITLAGWDTNISDSENIILRYLRFRPGAANVHSGSDSMDSLWGRDNDTFIIDHCSFSWCTDESLSVYRGENGTVQWSIISESLTLSGHSKGRHGYGGIFGGDNVTFHHNLIADHTSRNPRIGGGYAGYADADHIATLQISNNIIYNWGFNTIYGGGFANTNFINNYLKPGPGTRDNVAERVIDAGEATKVGGFYINGNLLEDNEAISADNSLGIHLSGVTEGENKTTLSDTPYETEGIRALPVEPANHIYNKILEQAGAVLPRRDAVDARVIDEVNNGKGRYINTEYEVGGYPVASASRPADFDKDQDGMADAWEIENGLDPTDSSDHKMIQSDGYSNLEHYINGLTDMNHKAENPKIALSVENNAQFTLGEKVTVDVEASSAYGHTITKVEFYSGAKKIGEDTTYPYSYDYTELKDGTYYLSAKAYDDQGNSTQSTTSQVHINTSSHTGQVGDLQEWTSSDIGVPAVPGSASLVNGILTVKGSGKLGKAEGSIPSTEAYDATKDDFHYVYQPITGDVEIITKLESITPVDNHAFSGIMIREDLTDSSAAAALGLSWVKITNTTWSIYLTGRDIGDSKFDYLGETLDKVANAEKEGICLVSDIPFKDGKEEKGYWLKLIRLGDTFIAYCSEDGISWRTVGERSIPMEEKVYVGFAVDGNQVANDLHQLNTSIFSNIEVNTLLYAVNYDLTNIEAIVAPISVTDGKDLSVILTSNLGYSLPDAITVTVNGEEVDVEYDKISGVITVPNVSGPVVIKAVGIYGEAPVEQVKLTEVDQSGLLEMSANGSTMILSQNAVEGYMPKDTTDLGSNVSYLLFPKTNKTETMELDLKIKDYSIIGNDAKRTGLFVGVFQDPELGGLFASLGFRGYDSSVGTDSLSGYWIKSGGYAGNGSPKYMVSMDTTYHVIFEKNEAGYLGTFTNEATGVTDSKQFKLSEMLLDAEDSVCYGLALVGTTVEVKNLTLKNERGNILYNQNDYYTEAGTAPIVTEWTLAEVSEDRNSIELAWKGEGAQGDGRYAVEVSLDKGNTYTKVTETADTSYSYAVTETGDYLFRVYGICADEETEALLSPVVAYQKPLATAVLSAESGAGEVTIYWEDIPEVTEYEVYRSLEKEGYYEKIASVTETTYVDSVVNEQPYYYRVMAKNETNASNLSKPIAIMASAGHKGDYVYGDEAAIFTLKEKSNDTIIDGEKARLKGSVSKDGIIELEVNGEKVKSRPIKAGNNFTFEIALVAGRNDVTLYLKEGNGNVSRKTFNFVALKSYDMVVDTSFEGEDGQSVDGIPTYRTVGAAIEDLPDDNNPYVIFIKEGKYYEKLNISKPYISLIGEDRDKTMLYYDHASGSLKPDGTTYGTSGSASMTIQSSAQRFTAENMTIANTFDYVNSDISGKQAVAFLNNADESMMTNVKFLGYQDTLYANGKSGVGGRQYYYKCYIEGNVDFIFGRAQAVFEDCDIVSLLAGYITAASTEMGRENGYIFANCRLYATDDVQESSVYLGRPWRAGAAVVYINCYMDKHISDIGYTDMGSNHHEEARYYEYGSYGEGFKITSTRKQLSASQAMMYSKENVFSADVETGGYDAPWDVNLAFESLSHNYGE